MYVRNINSNILLKVNRKLVFRIRNLLNISIIKETLLTGNWNKLSFSKLLLTTKILLVFLIENYNSLYFLPHCSYFCFSASESLKNFMLRPNRFNIIHCTEVIWVLVNIWRLFSIYVVYNRYEILDLESEVLIEASVNETFSNLPLLCRA